MGTVWTGGDVSARYERSRLSAQKQFDADASSSNPSEAESSITHSEPSDSIRTIDAPNPYATNTTSPPLPTSSVSVPPGKAAQQAAASRQQVMEDEGWSVLADEAEEERLAASASLRRSPRKRGVSNSIAGGSTTTSSTPTGKGKGSLKNLRERVSGGLEWSGNSGVLGMERSR